jgi:hypothetical protein
MYSPDKLYKVYEHKEWWTDKWSPFDYSKDFDFDKSFFEQLNNLLNQVPLPSLAVSGINENSEYCN